MRRGAGLLAEREEHVDRAGLGASGARATRELARALEGACERVRRVVDGDARGLEQDLGVEPAVEQELRGVVPSARQGGEQVGGGRLLASLLREILGGAAERDELRLPGR